jgi:uncharacterized membrane protein YfcA
MAESFLTHAWLGLSALAAGAVNSIAGGGTLLTFPALTAVVSPVVANGTSTVALVPGSVAGAWGYRREFHALARWAAILTGPSLVGGAIGTLLVTEFPESYFNALVPWLILTAALLFLLQPTLTRLTGVGKPHAKPSTGTLAGIVAFQFLVAIYGGYFGAGIGILMISSLSLMGAGDINHVNALKTFLAACINGVSVVVWVIEDKVRWDLVPVMVAAAIVGGYLGARVARRMPKNVVRWIVVGIGFTLAAYYFTRQLASQG